jgi:6-phosphogluconolactonase
MIEILADAAALARRAADLFVADVQGAAAARGAATVALTGGESPIDTYKLLGGQDLALRIPWQRVHLYWGDERCVPPDDAQSNFGLAQATMLSRLSLPPGSVHRMRGEDEPEEAARAYERELRAPPFGPRSSPRSVVQSPGTARTPALGDGTGLPLFDFVFLGLGPDGHVASLFPHATTLNEAEKLCVHTVAPDGLDRLSLTFPVLNAARRVVFLVNEPDKAGVVAEVLEGLRLPDAVPAQRVHPVLGELTWLLTEAAATELSPEAREAVGRA